MRLRRARAAPRWLESGHTPWKLLRQRNGPLARCTAVLRHASRGLQRAAYLRMCARKIAPLRALSLSLSRGSAARVLEARARCAALVGLGPCPMKTHCASETALSLGAWPCSGNPAATSNEQLTCACEQVKKRHCARSLSLSGGSAARALVARALAAALVGVGPCPMEAHCASGTALSLGERLCSDMSAAASNEKSEFACAHTRSRHRTLSLRRMRSTRACEVRAPRCAGWSRSIPHGSPLRQRNGPLARCTAVFRHASRGLQRAAYLRMCARKKAPLRSHSLSLEEAQHARLRHARAAPRWLELSIPYGSPLRQFHGHPPRCTAVLRHASCGLQRAAYLRMCAR